MNRWKVLFFLCLPLLCITSLVTLFLLLDNGTAYTYLEVSYIDQLQANEVLGNLVVKGGQEYTQKDFLHLLRQEYPSEFIVEEGDIVKMGASSFEFQNNRLFKVR